MQSLKTKISKLPQTPGVYQFYDKNKKLLYVGKSVYIKKRVASYFSTKNLGSKTDELVSKIADVKYIKVFSEFEALLLESDLIKIHKPFYNIQLKDDKSPIYIRIAKSPIPLIETTRKQNFPRSDFVKGPFPSAKTTKSILKLTRKVFAYCHHKNPKKPCLYVHLGLCPYPYADEASRISYLKNIKNIKKLLSGKSTILAKELTREMNNKSKLQQFEEANVIKRQLQNLEYLTTTYHEPREFLEQPTLVDDLSNARLIDLKKKLNLEKLPKRIECYDISNIQGKFATGSMSVFINGKPEKSQYRHFKIRYSNTPNDFKMIREVLGRRFKNNWPKPDLIIIDGGKGQLSSAIEIAKAFGQTMPIVSLAKKLEEIYMPNNKTPVSLQVESPARQLAQALRDEAHRFAITYHRNLRSKNFLE